MNQSDIPARFPIPFANAADGSHIRTIPTASQTPTATDAPASLTDGFPPITFLPLDSGGIPPSGKDFNGILKQLTAIARWLQAGGQAYYDATFVSAISGYPKGAVLASVNTPGLSFVSTVDGNTTNPEAVGAANWSSMVTVKSETDGAGNWRRVYSDGWTEMGGILVPIRGNEGPFTLTFPFGGFGSSCIGVSAVVRNTASSITGSTNIEEVSLSKTAAVLFAQNHQNTIGDAAGGIRWFARGWN